MGKEQVIQRCKEQLQTRQLELIQQVQSHYGLMESAKEMTGDLSSYDNHPAEQGTELFERGKDVALNEHAEKELEAINEALHAIEEGTYGICIKCGKDIPSERLLAVPTTATCKEHAEGESFTHERPIEEQVFDSHINPEEEMIADEEEVGYDAEDAYQEVSRYGTSETPSDLYGDQEDYDEMYPNSDEAVGTVEDIERQSQANIYGDEMTEADDR